MAVLSKPAAATKAMGMKAMKSNKTMKAMKAMAAMKEIKAMKGHKATKTMKVMKAMKATRPMKGMGAMVPPPGPVMCQNCRKSWVWMWKLYQLPHCTNCKAPWRDSIPEGVHQRAGANPSKPMEPQGAKATKTKDATETKATKKPASKGGSSHGKTMKAK
jgi:hypothetical protein